MKVGGDHGGGSFKMWISILNVDAPNAPQNHHLLLNAKCRDSRENLEHLLGPIKEQIDALNQTQWGEKTVRVFVCGDYEFITKLFGLSGAQGMHPCLWCLTTKVLMQLDPSGLPTPPQKRTLDSLKDDNRRFIEAGADKKDAKSFNNSIQSPILNIDLKQVALPSLHILLGNVKKHIVLMEKLVHEQIDTEIAKVLKPNTDMKKTTELFRCYTRTCRNIKEAEKRVKRLRQKGLKRQQ